MFGLIDFHSLETLDLDCRIVTSMYVNLMEEKN